MHGMERVTCFLLLVLSVFSASNADHGCEERAIDYVGNDIKVYSNVPTWQVCSEHCRDLHSCNAWTYNSRSRQCHLKSSSDGRIVSVGYISGNRSCGHVCEERGIDYVGNDINVYHNVPTWQVCSQRCRDEVSCNAWTWTMTRACHVKSNSSGRVFSLGYISGNRSCGERSNCTVDPCHRFASCRDTNSSYECTCRHGFTGNGFNCRDINECDSNPCHQFATCRNTEGSYQCTCNHGYMGNGLSCEEMWLPSARCGPAHLLSNGMRAQCNPKGGIPCCSAHGYCGNTEGHCACPTCVDHRHACVQNDMTYVAEIIREFHNLSEWRECSHKCKDMDGCAAWVWTSESYPDEMYRKVCYLKRHGNKMQTLLGARSGLKNCPLTVGGYFACKACKGAMDLLFKLLGSDFTASGVKHALGLVCNKVPIFQDTCHDLVNKYSQKIIDFIVKEGIRHGHALCKKLGVCSSFRAQEKMKLGLTFSTPYSPKVTPCHYKGYCKDNMCTRGSTGSTLDLGQTITSDNGMYTTTMQHDGNLVIRCNGNPIWSSRTDNVAINKGMMFQTDGNLVLYTHNEKALWSSSTERTGADHLIMQDDGNLVLYGYYGDMYFWASGTRGKC